MTAKTFYLNKQDGKFLGVCSGIADFTGVDATWIRVGAVVVTLLGAFPWTMIAYGVAALIARPKPLADYRRESGPALRSSTYEMQQSMRDIDRRMAEVETYVTSTNNSLAREIDQLR